MSDQKPLPLIGRIALQLRMVTAEQLSELTRAQAKEGDTGGLGELMVARGLIDRDQHKRLLDTQKQVVAKARARQALERADAEPEVATAPVPKPGAKPGAARAEGGSLPPAAPRSAPPRRREARRRARCEARARRGRRCEARGSGRRSREARRRARARRGSALRLRHARGSAARGRRARRERRPHPRRPPAPLPPPRPLRARATTRRSRRDRAEALRALGARRRQQRAQLEERGQVDFAYTLPGVGRFRANAYRQQRGFDAVFRAIPLEPPTLEDLGLPDHARPLHQLPPGPGARHRPGGLRQVLDAGRAGQHHQRGAPRPHPHHRGPDRVRAPVASAAWSTSARSGATPSSFARALRAALREDPDVIAIGELRDLETISLALTAAETGHLVLAHAAHQQRHPHHQPHPRRLPADAAGADPHHGLRVAARRRLAAPGAARRRQRPRAGARGPGRATRRWAT